MEEKKLTDEEVLRAFEQCTNGKCLNCAYRTDKDRCKHKKLNEDVLDLIHRLQSEKRELGIENKNWEELKSEKGDRR